MTDRKQPSALGSSFVSGAITQHSPHQTSAAYAVNSRRARLDVDRLVDKIGPLSSASTTSQNDSPHLGHHFSLAKGGLCSVSSAPSKMGNNIHKEDLGGAGHAQDMFDLVHPIARRSPANGETALADMMRRHGLLAAGELISDLKVTTKQQRSVRPRKIKKISAAVVDIHSKEIQRIVILKNDGGKYSFDFR